MNQPGSDISPISLKDLQKIEGTNLPMLERHQLRVLAHCLAVFKQISDGAHKGNFPNRALLEEWCWNQPLLKDDSEFIADLLNQFELAASKLVQLANNLGISPLELTLKNLIDASLLAQL